jgi:hypothetical protein
MREKPALESELYLLTWWSRRHIIMYFKFMNFALERRKKVGIWKSIIMPFRIRIRIRIMLMRQHWFLYTACIV